MGNKNLLAIGGDSEVRPLVADNIPENARVDVYRTLHGNCKLHVVDKRHQHGHVLEFTKDATIKIAFDMLRAVGVTAIVTSGAPPQ